MRDHILKKQRIKCRKRVAEHRQRNKVINLAASNLHSIADDDKYNTPSVESKALGKIIRAFPSTPGKQKFLLTKIFHLLDESVQLEIVLHKASIRQSSNAVSQDLVSKVRYFYERNDISRVSLNAKDVRYFVNESGKKQLQQIRHLMYRLYEVYASFIVEYGQDNWPHSFSTRFTYFQWKSCIFARWQRSNWRVIENFAICDRSMLS